MYSFFKPSIMDIFNILQSRETSLMNLHEPSGAAKVITVWPVSHLHTLASNAAGCW